MLGVNFEDYSKSPQAFELNDVSKYFHHPSPIDPIAVASTWMDEGSRLVFASVSMVSLIDGLKQVLPLDAINGLGAGWNFYDGIAGNISAIQQFRKLPEVQRRKKEKAAWAVQDLLLSEILITGTTLTLLAQYGVLTGLTAAACLPLASITFAAGTWGAFIHSAVNLKREYSKLNDKEYLFQDKMTKYNNTVEKLQKFNDEKNLAIDIYKKKRHKINQKIEELQATILLEFDKNQVNEKIRVLNNKLDLLETERLKKLQQIDEQTERWRKIQKRLGAQLQAIKQVKFENKLPPDLAAAFEKLNLAPTDPGAYELNKKIMTQLEKNQKEKIFKQTVATIGWATAAVGMTLVAVSPFLGPFAPIVFTVGIAITALAGAIKLVEVLGFRIANALARKHRYQIEQTELLHKYKNDLTTDSFKSPMFDGLSELEKLKYYLSYLYSVQNHPKLTQKQWYDSLNAPSISQKKRDAILNSALEKKIKEQVIEHTFQLNELPPKEAASQMEKIKEQITDKQLDTIVNRECRASLKEYLKEGLVSLFSHKKEKLVTEPTIEPDEHPRDAESM